MKIKSKKPTVEEVQIHQLFNPVVSPSFDHFWNSRRGLRWNGFEQEVFRILPPEFKERPNFNVHIIDHIGLLKYE